jgi:hypothetical protein
MGQPDACFNYKCMIDIRMKYRESALEKKKREIFEDFFLISHWKIRVRELCEGENYASKYGISFYRRCFFRAKYIVPLLLDLCVCTMSCNTERPTQHSTHTHNNSKATEQLKYTIGTEPTIAHKRK